MSSGPANRFSRSWPQWSDTGLRVLLIVGSIAIISLALALHFANDTVAPAVPAQAAGTEPLGASILNSTVTPGPTYIGLIAYKCDMNASTGFCLSDVSTHEVTTLVDAGIYENAQARDPFSPDGLRMAFSQRVGEGQDIFIRHVLAGWVDQIISTPDSEFQPAWSPDGHQLAYTIQKDAGTALWIYDLTTGMSRQLTYPEQWNDKHPTWSPDGNRIAFSSDRGGITGLYIADMDSGQTQQLDTGQVMGWDPVWIKPPIQQADSTEARNKVGIGIIFDRQQCQADISVGNNTNTPSISRVVVRTTANVLHDSGDMETPLYRANLTLDPRSGTTTLQVQVWTTDSPNIPIERQRTVMCVGLLPATPTATSQTETSISATPTPTWIVVTPPSEPADVFAAATMIVRATEQAVTVGTATPTPPNVATATFTPRPLVVTATPRPENEATQVAMDVMATAIAFTTGTPTPVSRPYVIATNTPVNTPTPAPTATPVMISVADLQRTPGAAYSPTAEPRFPSILIGKIVFLSDMSGTEEAYVMDPDGTNIARLTDRWPYEYAAQRDAYSADRRYHVYSQQEEAGFRHIQLFYRDTLYNVTKQTTFVGDGRAWLPAWSPTDEVVAFVSNQSGNDEIWLVQKDQWPAQQLTDNTWEWDHHPSWSPDGSQIVFSSNRSGQRQLWIMNADGTQQRRISPDTFEAWDPVWIKYTE